MAGELQFLRAGWIDDAASVLTRAFEDDPLYAFLVPRREARMRFLDALGGALLRALLPRGHVYAFMDSGVCGAIAFAPPGGYPLSFGSEMRMLVRLARSVLGTGGAFRLARRGMATWGALSRLHPTMPHYYLAMVGVEPRRQGTGLGRALIAPGLERADAERVPVYLETANPANLPFYRRFGFEVVEELRPVEDSPPLWTMLRPSAAGASRPPS